MQSFTMTLEKLNKLNKKRKLVKLDIGAGGYSADTSFLSVDLFTDADIIANMWDIPVPDKSVDVIFSSQALEHVGKNEVIPTLQEWARILKPGGRLQLVVPDLEWACMWWLTHQGTDWPLDVIYGNQNHLGEFHKTGFSIPILIEYFDKIPELVINKIEYLGGQVELRLADDGKIAEEVSQKNIVVESTKAHVEGRSINVEAYKDENS